MSYKGKYKVKKPEKYDGDFTNVIYRSLWERQFFRWCEDNSDVVRWSSESVVIPYRCKTDNKMHRYFVDVKVKFKSGKIYLIEIKPEIQTKPPVKKKRKSQKYLKEVMTYIKNESKWEQAEKYCKQRGWEFKIFTENTLKSLGIRLLTT
jgi:DNA mismatch repair ATPase MutL|tara:strand:+ start:128 stop:574 length:447 start_codon:yes stop_codon:yes gene_type:complete